MEVIQPKPPVLQAHVTSISEHPNSIVDNLAPAPTPAAATEQLNIQPVSNQKLNDNKAPTSTEQSYYVEEESPEVNVAINNVVCTFSTRCHLNLKTLALNGFNVELKKAQGMLNMKLRKPSATASIWSSGKITVTGASSEYNCKTAARRIARLIQRIGFNVR